MATKYENYVTGDDNTHVVGGNSWIGQTFTPSLNHTVTSVKVEVHRVGSPGTFTISIRATSGGVPFGSDLTVGTTNGNSVTTNVAGEWIEVTLSTGALLAASTVYAIVCRCADAAGGNYLAWHSDTSSPTYTGGSYCAGPSDDNWAVNTDNDEMFEEWGDATGTPTVTTQAVTSIVTTTATGNGNVTDLGDSNVTEHGHCWNTGGLPTTSDSKTTNGSKATTGTFTSSLTSLTSGTLYYVRAYATNTDGTTYGDEVSFTAGSPRGGELSGLYAVVEERFHYVDAYGIERALLGEPV